MIYGAIVIAELTFLFLFSQQLSKSLSILFQMLRFNQKLIVLLMAFIFFPGTVIHELAHFLMAKVLFVQTGKISFLPKLQGSTIRMGTAEIGQSDKFRQLLIGIAPFIVGLTIIFVSLYLFIPRISLSNYWNISLFTYLLFTVSNSMFSSKKDLENSFFFIVIFFLFSILLILFDKSIVFQIQVVLSLIPQHYWLTIIYYLLLPLALDILILIVLRLFIRLFK